MRWGSRKRGVIPGIKRWVIRGVFSVLGLWLAGIVLFAFVPVPFSAVMAERRLLLRCALKLGADG